MPLGYLHERLQSGCRSSAIENECQTAVMPLRADAACTTFSSDGKTSASGIGKLSRAASLNLRCRWSSPLSFLVYPYTIAIGWRWLRPPRITKAVVVVPIPFCSMCQSLSQSQ